MMPFDNAEHNALSFSEQGDLAKYAETLGFTSLFVRDKMIMHYARHYQKASLTQALNVVL